MPSDRARRRAAVQLTIMVIGIGVLGAFLPGLRVDNGLDAWISHEGEVGSALERAVQSFGEGRELLIGWDDDKPLSEASLDVGRLRSTQARAIQGVREAIALGDVLDELGARVDELPASAWEAPLIRGTFLGQDAAGMLVELDGDAAGETVEALLAALEEAADGAHIHAAGAVVLNAGLDRAAREAPVIMLPLLGLVTVLVITVLAALMPSARRASLILLPAVAGTGGIVATLGAMTATGASLDMVTIAAPALVWVAGAATGVHAAHAALMGELQAVRPAILWSASTTALGLLSLLASGVTPLMTFGAMGALGVIVAALLAEALATRLRPSEVQDEIRGITRTGKLAPGLPLLLLAGAFLVGIGATQLQVHANPLEYLPEGNRTVRDYDWIDARFGGLLPVLVLVEGANSEQRQTFAFQVAEQLRESGVSASAWSPHVLRELPEGNLRTRLLARLEDAARGRTLVRVRASGIGMESLVAVREQVSAVPQPPGVRVTVTGVAPLIIDLQQRLLEAQRSSLGIAIATVVVALVCLTRSLTLCVAGLLPNLLPAAVILGGLGWSGRGLDPATAMVTAIAIAIAVDDTLHVLVAFRHERQQGRRGAEAARHAVSRVVRPMTLTTVTLVLGFLTFVTAPFSPVQDFGLLVAAALATGWFADLVLLPWLLSVLDR